MSKISADNKDIKFPAQHYVNFQSRPTSDNTPLGFMTPWGDDAAGKKRRETVDSWANVYDHSTKTHRQGEGVKYDNKPMVGFKLAREVRRYASFGNGNVKWRIEDPRGFELEISSSNFAQILLLCTMERGEIQEQLIWGRMGSENILVPLNSEAYEAAQANTARVAKKASLKDIAIGDTAILHNGKKGVYMGTFYFVKVSKNPREFGIKGLDNKRHVFLINNQYEGIGSPKISEIIPGDRTATLDQSLATLNGLLLNPKSKQSLSDNSNDYSWQITAVSKTKIDPKDIRLVSSTLTLDKDGLTASKAKEVVFFKHGGYMVATQASSILEALNKPAAPHSWSHRNDGFWVYYFDKAAFDNGQFEPLKDSHGGRYATTKQQFLYPNSLPSEGQVFYYEVTINGEDHVISIASER